jgi:uncharacterized cupredoxin-like copper-binding protein
MVDVMDNYLTSTEPSQEPHRPGWRLASLVAAALALGPVVLACGGDDADDLASPTGAGVARLEVTAREEPSAPTGNRYEFDMPDQVPAGAARLSVTNEGDEEHHAQLFRLDDGATLEELSVALASGGPAAAAAFGAFAGGTGLVAPGSESRADAVVELTPGTYVLLCLVPDAAGAPHLAHGMLRQFEVAETDDPPALPNADADVELVDYAFDLPDTIDGDAALRITNAGSEPHEMIVLRLDDGATADDVARALADGAPPPGTALGGMQALLPGATQQLQLDLEPGEYAVICHVPSADGTPHHVRGMIRQVTVG